MPAKPSLHTSTRFLVRCLLAGFWLVILPAAAQARFQVKADTTAAVADTTVSDSTTADSSVVRPPRPDSTRFQPTGPERQGRINNPAGAGQGQQAGEDGKSPVQFQASDSLVFTFGEQREATLFGSAQVSHPSGQLKAGQIALNLDRNLVSAATETPGDTLSQPVLVRDQDKIRSQRILFNYATEKGKFDVARVAVDKGNLIGTEVKKTDKDVVFIKDGIYSTCTLDHPHYYIKADKMKVVNQEEIFFTNARLYILDIPYPMIFPFGYVPAKMDRHQSGILPPIYAYQQQQTRGIGLQNLGWFQYFSDYLTGQASVDIFTSGTFGSDVKLNYRKRDTYSGSISLGYSREQGLEPTDPGFSTTVNKKISITHSQDFSPYARMSANVNLRTADYYKRNSYDTNQRASTSTNSKLSYNYNDPGNRFTFSANMQQNRNFLYNTASLTGPNLNFNVRNFSPFQKGDQRSGQSRDAAWYENITVGYNNNFRTSFKYNPVRADSAQISWFDALLSPSKYREASDDNRYIEYALKQHGSVTANNVLPSRFINSSINFNFNEYWYPTSIRKSFNADSGVVETRKVNGFVAAHDFTSSINFSTTIYGLWNRKIGKLAGFRHTLRPSISFSYSPDFTSDFWGYYRNVRVDSNTVRKYSILENGIIGGPSGSEVRSVNFSLNNILETKLVKRDSTGEKNERNLRLIDRLDARTSYNFAADSLKLRDMSTTFSSNVIQGLNISANANFNFYQRDSTGNKIDRFRWNQGKFPQMTHFSLQASTRFSGGDSRGVKIGTPSYPAHYDPYNQSVFNPMDPRFNRMPVEPLNSPWSFSLSFSYSWNYRPNSSPSKSAILNVQNIQFQLTPKWRFSTQIGYDFIKKELTPSQFSLNRNLHCWDLSFTMNPFGQFQYYMFSLRVNSAQIQSLFQKLPVLKNLQRSSSPINRSRF